MKHPVIAIGLDSADPFLLEAWMAAGLLPNLSQIRQGGVYGRLNNQVDYCGVSTEFSSTEPLWVTFLSGCLPSKTGYWDTIKYHPNYQTNCDIINGGYDFKEYPPFYALGDRYKVAVFDMPVSALSERVNGLQVIGWGGHYPFTPSHSLPRNLLPEIIQKYGKNPVLHKDNGIWWDKAYMKWTQQALKASIDTRTAIAQDLLKRDNWDLFLMAFPETHTAAHDLWHLSQPDHPLHPYQEIRQGITGDPMLKVYQQVDQAVGKILAEAPDDAYIFCFSVHGMGINVTDMFSMTFLPEALYRYNFPGRVGIAPGKVGEQLSAPKVNIRAKDWMAVAWGTKVETNPIKQWLKPLIPNRFQRGGNDDLLSPYQLARRGDDLLYMPARWYCTMWPKMRAFALPAFADGHVRINLQGREQHGIVPPDQYDNVCNEFTEMILRLKSGRTGRPLAKEIRRTRQSPHEENPKLPDADLIVVWHEEPTDAVESSDVGRIGPLVYYRPGGHRPRGFMIAKGQGITPGSELTEGRAVDVSATILNTLGASIPDYFDGKPLLHVSNALVAH
jgi:predicted AlkP superfamily phosphohydrolase/phosphomutase